MNKSKAKQFIGRKHELAELKRLTRKKRASLVVIKGRRRIGKSRLVDEFASAYTYYKFTGLAPDKNITAQMQREEFCRQLVNQFNIPPIAVDDWGDIFDWLGKLTQSGQHIILLDEISWMGHDDPSFLPKLKTAWDMYFNNNPEIILVLCGSVSSWIEKNILSSTGYFGRIAIEMTLDELNISSCNKMLHSLSFHGSTMEKLTLLSLTGGVPWYMELVNPSLSAIENIKALCFRKNGILVKEYQRIFHDLFGKRGEFYRKIIDCLLDGPKSYTNIVDMTHYTSGGPLSDYLRDLTLSGFICRDFSWQLKTGKQSKISQYRLKDNFLRFYIKCIAPNITRIEKDLYHHGPLTSIPGWSTIIGLQFENLVLHNRAHIWKKLNINPADIINENPFLQMSTKTKQGCQIDYMIQTKFNLIYIIEIKFSQNPIGTNVIKAIKQKIEALQMPRGFAFKPVLIHVNGVSGAVIESEYFAEIIDFGEYVQE